MSGDTPDQPEALVSPAEALKEIKQVGPVARLLHRSPRQALTDDEIVTQNEVVKLQLRRRIGWFAILLTGCQVVLADVVFILYAANGRHWKLSDAAIESWLAATVIQVIGVLLVITRSLFPGRRSGDPLP